MLELELEVLLLMLLMFDVVDAVDVARDFSHTLPIISGYTGLIPLALFQAPQYRMTYDSGR